MTDKQFNDTFTAAGGWFILTQYEKIINWNGKNTDLVDQVFSLGFDKERVRTSSRVSCVRRLIREKRIEEAIIKIRDSKTINTQHPEAFHLASDILRRYF